MSWCRRKSRRGRRGKVRRWWHSWAIMTKPWTGVHSIACREDGALSARGSRTSLKGFFERLKLASTHVTGRQVYLSMCSLPPNPQRAYAPIASPVSSLALWLQSRNVNRHTAIVQILSTYPSNSIRHGRRSRLPQLAPECAPHHPPHIPGLSNR
jgi:hypothetical protein